MSKVRFVARRIIFGSDETHDRWSVEDPTDEKICEAAWKARYAKSELTQTDCYDLAGAFGTLYYLLVLCPTTELAVEKLRAIRRAVRERSLRCRRVTA